MKNILTLAMLLLTSVLYSQKYVLVEINSEWNLRNSAKIDKVKNIEIKKAYLEDQPRSLQNKIKSFKLPWGKLGLTICYDLRFPNLYRKLSKQGSIFLAVPSAFTETTGKRHWHSLLKARAIENFCYIFAPAQAGKHYNGRKTFGNSLIVSPDGKILKSGDSKFLANDDEAKRLYLGENFRLD